MFLFTSLHFTTTVYAQVSFMYSLIMLASRLCFVFSLSICRIRQSTTLSLYIKSMSYCYTTSVHQSNVVGVVFTIVLGIMLSLEPIFSALVFWLCKCNLFSSVLCGRNAA